jgi:hypothetical protein
LSKILRASRRTYAESSSSSHHGGDDLFASAFIEDDLDLFLDAFIAARKVSATVPVKTWKAILEACDITSPELLAPAHLPAADLARILSIEIGTAVKVKTFASRSC